MSFRDETGFTVMELVIGMTIMIVILGATLAAMSSFEKTTRINQLQNDSQEAVRKATDQLTRELRNHASATRELPQGMDVAEPYDLVFQTINPARLSTTGNTRGLRRVRYCVDDPGTGSARLWTQTQDWTTTAAPPLPSTASCPSGAWGNQRVLSEHITNRVGELNRPAFCPETPTVADCDYSGANLGEINRIRTILYVDSNVGEKPGETKLESGVHLRNRNRPPVPAFTFTLGAQRSVLLNASDTTEPDGDQMTFVWLNGGTEIGRGKTLTWRAPAPGSYPISLEVSDRTGLMESVQQEVVIP
jgi:type II secretory pathway pseudopilin PulG